MEISDPRAFYNERMPNKFGPDYEHERWHKDLIREAGYLLTKEAIERHVLSRDDLSPARILEVGPGPGVWTKFLMKRYPNAAIDLVDISREMLERARRVLGVREGLRYIEADILEWTPDTNYDFFFASRILEYVEDKHAFAKKVFELLVAGGEGFLITKMPHYRRERFLGKRSSQFHRGQVSPPTLMRIFREAGLIDLDCFPVTTSVPIVRSAFLNRFLGRILGSSQIGPFGMFFAESYCLLFRKP